MTKLIKFESTSSEAEMLFQKPISASDCLLEWYRSMEAKPLSEKIKLVYHPREPYPVILP